MKMLSSPRRVSLLLLAGFGVLLIIMTVVAVRFSRDVSLVQQTDNLRDNLETIAGSISERLDSGYPDPYGFIELTARTQKKKEHYSLVLQDASGALLAPSFVVDKGLDIKDILYFDKDDDHFMATVWGQRCFVVVYDFPDRPLTLLGLYDNKYIFDDIVVSEKLFIILISAFFLILLLLSWFWLIPAIERMYDRKDKAEIELSVARELQQKAVTRDFTKEPWFDIHAELRAMKDVGGDIYLCGMVGNKLCFIVGDVSDKGTAASFMMFLLSSFIRSRVQVGLPLDRLMGEVNRIICDNPDYGMFCTLFIGAVNPDTLEMEYCNAGHTRALVDGEFLEQDPQLIAGIDRGFVWHTQKVMLHHGSRLLLYTDGVTEARNEERAFFGEKRLREWMRSRPEGISCREDCSALLEAVGAFRGKAHQNDDIAIMCIKIL